MPLSEKERVISLPFLANPSFVGRNGILDEIHSEFQNPKGDHRISIYGLGGIGSV
jgi:hypothetical protein